MPNPGKRTTPASVAVALMIFAVVAVFLTTGQITVTSQDAFLHIRCTHWPDRKVSYADVVSVDCREELDAGQRQWGIESAKLSAGTFSNSELGSYTLYAPVDAKAYVILMTTDAPVAIGLTTTEEAQMLTRTISEKIQEENP